MLAVLVVYGWLDVVWFVEWSCDYLHVDLVYIDVCVCVFDRFRLVESIDIVSILNLTWSFDN